MTKNISTDLFYKDGYLILDLIDEVWLETASKLIHDRVDEVRQSAIGETGNSDWTLASYHEKIGSDDDVHNRLMAHAVRYINMTDDMVPPLLQWPVEDILDHYWGHREPLITHRGHELPDEKEGDYACGFRFVRPYVTDVTGVHVDTYFGSKSDAYDRSLEDCVDSGAEDPDLITIWIPVVGFDERYSLRLAPGTHTINHPVEAFVKSPDFITQAVNQDYESKFDYIRPNLKPGQAIVFHPNLLHGGSSNLGGSTRVSMEVRLHNPRKRKTKD